MIDNYAECLSLPGAKTSLVRSASQFVSEEMKHVHEKFKQIELKLSEIKNSYNEMKTLDEPEPEHSTLEVVEPDSLFKKEKSINYKYLIYKF